MKIISEFHDYYDLALGFGHDYSLIYNRKQIDIPKTEWDHTFNTFGNSKQHINKQQILYTSGHYGGRKLSDRTSLEYGSRIIGFCGKIYPLIVYEYKDKNMLSVDDIAYTPDIILNYLEELEVARSGRKKGGLHYWKNDLTPYDKVSEFFAQDLSFLEKIFFKYKVPAFAIHPPSSYWGHEDGKLTLNPPLKDYGFHHVLEHFQVFQQIEQYLSGVIGSEGPVLVQLSNEERITKAGFDKWSFRKLPTKRRKV